MTSWIIPSDTHAPLDTGHTTDHNHIADDLTLINTVIPAVSGGLTGATSTFRIVGAIASGTAPASGTFAAGDVIIVLTGGIIVCTAGGSVGTWVPLVPALPLSLANGGTGVNAGSDAALLTAIGAAAVAGATFTGAIIPAVVSLTFVGGGTTLVNAALGNDFRLTVTASTTTIGNPSNSVDGQRIDFQLTQGTGGSFTVTWGGNYDFGASGAPTLSTAATKVDVIGFVYNAALTKWVYVGAALGN